MKSLEFCLFLGKLLASYLMYNCPITFSKNFLHWEASEVAKDNYCVRIIFVNSEDEKSQSLFDINIVFNPTRNAVSKMQLNVYPDVDIISEKEVSYIRDFFMKLGYPVAHK